MKSNEANRLFDAHEQYARKIANKMRSRMLDLEQDEIVNAALTGLWIAATRYQPSRGEAAFRSFAYPRIVGEIIDVARSQHHLSKNQLQEQDRPTLTHLGILVEIVPDCEPEPPSEQTQRLREHLYSLIDQLPEAYSVLILAWMRGEAFTEIARQHGKPKSTIRWRIMEGIKKMKALANSQGENTGGENDSNG